MNFLNTANVYSQGGAEAFRGEVLAGRPRDSYVLATKLYFPMNGDRGLSRPQVLKQIDASLGRLRTDYVDLYQCHRYDYDTPLEETMEALTEVVRQGKARYLGFSEWTADQIGASLDLSSSRGLEKFVSSQPQYSLLYRAPEREVIPLCQENGISQIVWSPLARGALTGHYKPGQQPPRCARAAASQMRWSTDGFRHAGEPGTEQRIAVHKGSLLFEEHSPHPEGHRFGNIHFALDVPRDRLDAAVAHVRSKGVEVYGPEHVEWMNAIAYYFYDPDGNLLEFWSLEPETD